MSKRLLFISDLHLEDSRPDITNSLLRFLEDNTGSCDCLYILGDLFEAWIGDDDSNELSNSVALALKTFSKSGARLYFMHGNRDFLLGEGFAESCGGSLLDDPSIIETSLGPVLLSHGDALCTDDLDYMQFRQLVRQPSWQQDFLSKSLDERRAFAQQARQQSHAATQEKTAEIMDVNQQAVIELLTDNAVTTLLHGHTHRPDSHEISLDTPIGGASKARRVVLGDWDKQGWYGEIKAGNNSIRLQCFPLTGSASCREMPVSG